MCSLQKKLGARIQEIRKNKKLTQEHLAEIIGIDIPNISNIERGKRFVSAATLEKIIDALGVSAKELFSFDHKNDREFIIEDINKYLNKAKQQELELVYKIILDIFN